MFRTNRGFSGQSSAYIKVEEFQKGIVDLLQTLPNETSLNHYDEDALNGLFGDYGNNTGTVISEDKIEVEGQTYFLELEEKEKTIKENQEPSPLVKKNWDDRVKSLLRACDLILEKIQSYKSKNCVEMTSNLLVDSKLSKIVFASLDQVEREIQLLKIEIEKVKHSYEHTE